MQETLLHFEQSIVHKKIHTAVHQGWLYTIIDDFGKWNASACRMNDGEDSVRIGDFKSYEKAALACGKHARALEWAKGGTHPRRA